jgi:hypothetical protein
MDAVVRAYQVFVRPIHMTAFGLRQHYVLTNMETGAAQIIGIWDSQDAIASIATRLEPARERLWAQFGCNPPLEAYEVVDELRPTPARAETKGDHNVHGHGQWC